MSKLNIAKVLDGFKSDYSIELIDIISNFNGQSLDELMAFIEDINDNGSIDELIDSKIDIYNHTLREWAVDNYGYIEDAVDEFGVQMPFDFHKVIQMGQYMQLSEDINKEIEGIKEYIQDKYTF